MMGGNLRKKKKKQRKKSKGKKQKGGMIQKGHSSELKWVAVALN